MKRSAAVLSVLALLAPACAAPSGEPAPATVFSPPRQSSAPKVARLGDTLDLTRIGEGRIAVTVVRVIDPAVAAYGLGDPGKNYLAVEVTIKNTGATTIVGNANSDVGVIGSDAKGYARDLATVTECKNFVFGWFLLAVGASTTGCVTFALPPGVSVAKVKYSPSSGISHDVGEWVIS